MPDHTPRIDRREELPGVQYWCRDDKRPIQRFYTLTFLALASIHDRFVALERRSKGDLNWSATMAYYSVVHAARFTIRRRFYRGLSNLFELYLPLATKWQVFDNSGKTGLALLARGQRAVVERVARPIEWKRLKELANHAQA